MNKNITIINSSRDDYTSLAKTLSSFGNDYNFSLLTNDKKNALTEEFRDKKWKIKKIYTGPGAEEQPILFVIFIVFLFFVSFFMLLKEKIKNKTNIVILLGVNEKITFSLAAKILGIKIIWLEGRLNTINNVAKNKIYFWFYKKTSTWVKIIAINNYIATKLDNLGIKRENTTVISPGIEWAQYNYQDNIFTEIADSGQKKYKNKFFTIGVISPLDNDQKIEALMRAVKNSLVTVPNLQLMIIGEGSEKNNLSWVAKRLEIDSLVWFVGKQGSIKKWLKSLNMLIISRRNMALSDFDIALKAMAANIPIIAPAEEGLEDIIENGKNGFLVKIDDSEILTQKIISLCHSKEVLEKIKKEGMKKVKDFTVENQKEMIKKLF